MQVLQVLFDNVVGVWIVVKETTSFEGLDGRWLVALLDQYLQIVQFL